MFCLLSVFRSPRGNYAHRFWDLYERWTIHARAQNYLRISNGEQTNIV